MSPAAAKKAQLIKLIHVGKGQLKLDEENYRALLKAETGCDSTKAMSLSQLERILQRLRKDGFRVRYQAPNGNLSRDIARDKRDSKIRALWLEGYAAGKIRDKSEKALNAWIQRMTGVAALQWLDSDQKSQVIEMLKKFVARTGP